MTQGIKHISKKAFPGAIFLALFLGMITAGANVPGLSLSTKPSGGPESFATESFVLPTVVTNDNETAENETAALLAIPVNLTTILDFLDRLLNRTQSLHSDQPGEHLSLIATYQAAFIARVLGLDHFKDASDTAKIANLTADQDLGFRINNETEVASIAATFGAGNTLYLLNATDLVNSSATARFLRSRYNSTGSFRDLGKTGTLLATYQAVQVDQLLQTAVVNPTMVDPIISFLETLWKPGYFLDAEVREGPFVQTWVAVSLLEELNKTQAVQLNQTQFADYSAQVNSWLTDNYNDSLTNNTLTIQDAVAAILTLQKLKRLDSAGINMTEFVEFIALSQRSEAEETHFVGGFATSATADEATVSVENSFMAILGLLAIGRVFDNLTMTLSTAFGSGENLPQQVIQGDNETIQLAFQLFNSSIPEVDYLNISAEIDEPNANWTLSEPEYSGLSRYASTIQSSDNWTLENHTVKIFVNLDRIPFISLPDRLFEDYIAVAYEIQVITNSSNFIRPTSGVQMDLQIMNRSVTTHESLNVTASNVSVTLGYPIDGKYRNLTNSVWNGSIVPANDTNVFQLEADGITTINFTIPNRVVLGDYSVRIANVTTNRTLRDFSIQVFVAETQFQLQALNDTLNFCTSKNDTTLVPGKTFNLSATLKYTVEPLRLPNGSLNASFVMTSTVNDSLSFSIPFEFWKDVNETTIYRAGANATVPRRPLMGNFSVRVEFTWNLTAGYITSSVMNPELPFVYVVGTPIAQNATIIAESGNLTSGPVTIFYGEQVNASFEIGINETRTSLLEDTHVRAFLWNMSGGLVEEMTYLNQTNTTHPFTTAIDPNTPRAAYQIGVQLTLPHNGTVLNMTQFYLPGVGTPLIFQEYQFSLDGTLEILESSVQYISVSNEKNQTAIDEFPVFSARFQVHCEESDEFITGLNLYGKLVGEENATFPDVGFSKDERYYQVWIPVEDLPEGEYELELYTHTAVVADTLIGSIVIDLVKTLESPPSEEEFKWPVVTAGLLFLLTLILILWNFRLREPKS
ncbi:MAG: hypothetical protein ACE5OZ_16720 [Candidatus Heimdallarchaeota archaeon]